MTISDVRPAEREAATHVAVRASGAAFETVEVHAVAAPVLEAWAELERVAPCSIYQSRAWLLPWIDALAAPTGLAPRFVLARDADARPIALLCLGVRRRGPVRIATWLGGKDANFNMALLAPAAWTRRELTRLLRTAAREMRRAAPDLLVLGNQPYAFVGIANPLALLAHQASPSAAYGTALPAEDAESLFAEKLSKDTRKKLRKKEAKLAALGPLAHVIASDEAERREVIDAFLALRNARFRAQSIASPFEAAEMADFIVAASAGPGIELHALKVGARIVAVYGGAAHQGQWSGMFNAFDMDPAIAASSPGDLLLMRIVAKCCRDGLARFDLGIGAARYKASLCEEIALFDNFVPLSAAGQALALAIGAKQALKRTIKRNPRLFALAKRLRAATLTARA